MNLETMIAFVRPIVGEIAKLDREIAQLVDDGVKTGEILASVPKTKELRLSRDTLRELGELRLNQAVRDYESEHGHFPCHAGSLEACLESMTRNVEAQRRADEERRELELKSERKRRAKQGADRGSDVVVDDGRRRREEVAARTEAAISASRANRDKVAKELEQLAQAHRARSGT